MLQDQYLNTKKINKDSRVSQIDRMLISLIGDGSFEVGTLSNYIDLIDAKMEYDIENINSLAIKDLTLMKEEAKGASEKFNLNNISDDIRGYLFKDGFFKIRYFVK